MLQQARIFHLWKVALFSKKGATYSDILRINWKRWPLIVLKGATLQFIKEVQRRYHIVIGR